jgi:hypothetical protein
MLEYSGEFSRVAQAAAKARGEPVSDEDLDARARRLKEAAGNERVAKGSYLPPAGRTNPRAG